MKDKTGLPQYNDPKDIHEPETRSTNPVNANITGSVLDVLTTIVYSDNEIVSSNNDVVWFV
jgi:hypothetical protein